MSRLRCHELDRKDELNSILFNRGLSYYKEEREPDLRAQHSKL